MLGASCLCGSSVRKRALCFPTAVVKSKSSLCAQCNVTLGLSTKCMVICRSGEKLRLPVFSPVTFCELCWFSTARLLHLRVRSYLGNSTFLSTGETSRKNSPRLFGIPLWGVVVFWKAIIWKAITWKCYFADQLCLCVSKSANTSKNFCFFLPVNLAEVALQLK